MPEGLLVIYVLIENGAQQPPSQNDLSAYANQYGMTCPVMADNNYQLFSNFEVDQYIPSISLVKYDGTILAKDDIDQVNAQMNAAMPPYGGP
jgi:hypothetical protein